MVGLCSNYNLIIVSVKGVILSAMKGVTASVGNLNAVESKERKEYIFFNLIFVSYIIYSLCAIAFICLLNPFIKLWLGNDYVLELGVPIALSVAFFLCGIRTPAYTYRVTMGLFEKGKMTPYISTVSNIVLSILFCKLWGVAGIFIATAVTELDSYSIFDPYLIYKYEFKKSSKLYWKKMLQYFVIFTINTVICLLLTQLITFDGVIALTIKGIIVTVITVGIDFMVFRKTDEFRYCYDKFAVPTLRKLKIKV